MSRIAAAITAILVFLLILTLPNFPCEVLQKIFETPKASY